MERLYTLGVYGTDEKTFFDALVTAEIDIVCDIRQRRGVRGTTYAYVNSIYFQSRLQELGIDYLYYKKLAPTRSIRQVQVEADKTIGTTKRKRDILGEAFIKAYKEEILVNFDAQDFLKVAGHYKNVCLFCVECLPAACHRSIVSLELSNRFSISLEHLIPCQQKEF